MPPEPRVANFSSLTSVSGASYIFNGSKWWTEVHWPLITSIGTSAFSNTQGNYVKELYLDSMTYDASAKPTGFPWGIAANTYYWNFKINFSNCTIQQIQGTGWVIVEE